VLAVWNALDEGERNDFSSDCVASVEGKSPDGDKLKRVLSDVLPKLAYQSGDEPGVRKYLLLYLFGYTTADYFNTQF